MHFNNELKDAKESVRSLNEWVPSGRRSPRVKTTPPPTARLYLDFKRHGIGHGQTQKQKNALILQKQKLLNNVIVSDVRRGEELSKEERKQLKAQMKVIAKVSPRLKNHNDSDQTIFRLFRRCQPDIFGNVSRETFMTNVRDEYGLNESEANDLFKFGAKGQNELTFKEFREAFKRLDRTNTRIPDEHNKRPRIKVVRKKHPDRKEGYLAAMKDKKSFGMMTQEERDEFKVRSNILEALEMKRIPMKKCFRREEKPAPDSMAVRTKLSHNEVSDILRNFGVHVPSDKLKEMYRGEQGKEDGLTFSQLCQQTDEYFNRIMGFEEPSSHAYQMEIKGNFVGCRRMMTECRPGQNLSSIQETMAGNQPLAYWTEKTIPKSERTRGLKISNLAKRMYHGNGNILSWNHDGPLGSFRNSLVPLETDRTNDSLSIWDTARSHDIQ